MRRANDGAMYVGRLVGSSLSNIDRMLVAYFLTSAAVGYYALVFSLVAPITLGVQSIAIAGYAGLARSQEIPRNLLYMTAGWLLTSAVLGYVLITVFINRFLPAYHPTLGILVPAVLTAVALGVIALFNQPQSLLRSDPARGHQGRGICELGDRDGAPRREPHRLLALPSDHRPVTAGVDPATADGRSKGAGAIRHRDVVTSLMRVANGALTHFQEAGLSRGLLPRSGRHLVLTVDIEAFDADRIELWCQAMADWGRQAAAADLRFSHFVSMEHVARLRAQHPKAHERFLAALRPLLAGGSKVYPHNHCVFDPATGHCPGESSGWPQRIPGYRPRASMFFDVVRRHNIDLAQWLKVVTAEYDQLLGDARVPAPSRAAFRPGGWDHGSTPEELQTYVRALRHCGYVIDSSDAVGTFGGPSWRVGMPFGKNAYWLSDGLMELAPSWSLTCGAPATSRQGLAALVALARQPQLWMSRQRGVSVGVLHFDHVFRDWHRRDGAFGVRSSAVVADRIHRVMGALAIVQARLGFEPATFDDLPLPVAAERAHLSRLPR
jgi:hypothetical protein